jgi:hypothetical protein
MIRNICLPETANITNQTYYAITLEKMLTLISDACRGLSHVVLLLLRCCAFESRGTVVPHRGKLSSVNFSAVVISRTIRAGSNLYRI